MDAPPRFGPQDALAESSVNGVRDTPIVTTYIDKAALLLEPETQTVRLQELTSGLALEYVRVRLLKELAQAVHAGLVEHGVWYTDAANRPQVRDTPIKVLRELLMDIAAELGHRVKRVEIIDETAIRKMAEDAGVDADAVLKRIRAIK